MSLGDVDEQNSSSNASAALYYRRVRYEGGGAAAVRRRGLKTRFPNFFRSNPLKSLKTAKKMFGKVWTPSRAPLIGKGFFVQQYLAKPLFLGNPRIFQIFVRTRPGRRRGDSARAETCLTCNGKFEAADPLGTRPRGLTAPRRTVPPCRRPARRFRLPTSPGRRGRSFRPASRRRSCRHRASSRSARRSRNR